jgi:hypothetical protein
MDVVGSPDPRPLDRRVGVVAVALVLLGGGQAAAVRAVGDLPGDVALAALENGYSYGTTDRLATLGFQLVNSGDRAVRVVDVGRSLPGLELVDVVAGGSSLAGEVLGAGSDPLPEFPLATGDVVELTLVYDVADCAEVPTTRAPLPVEVQAGRARGTVLVPLPTSVAADPDAPPGAMDEWQQVLVRDVCTSF